MSAEETLECRYEPEAGNPKVILACAILEAIVMATF
jgi:hypothetical protein